MKNLIDSSGWIEYFAGGENANQFTPPIQDLENLIVPTICLYEVFKRLLIDLDEESALQAVGVMSLGTLIDLNRSLALEAARLSFDLKLAMADSVILATARTHEAMLWTQDQHFKDLDGVHYIAK